MATSQKFLVQFEEGTRASKLPVKISSLQAVLGLFCREVKNEPEWIETVEMLRGTPRVVGLCFCGDVMMRELQRKFRKLDRTTDVLSFPAREIDGPADLSWIPDQDRSLGDLVISLPAIERGARRGRRKPAEELVEVLLHGLLHLIGCDHVTNKNDARRMRSLQRGLFLKARAFIK
jgi:rRNA maturation RNase YbeY